MRHDQHITNPMTYPMTDPQMKTKTMNMTMDKTRVQYCDVRAVSHSCDVFIHSCTYAGKKCDFHTIHRVLSIAVSKLKCKQNIKKESQ